MWLKFIFGLFLCLIFYLFNNFHKQASRKDANSLVTITKEGVLWPPNVEVPLPPSASILNVYERAAVCSDKSICSNIGSIILQHDGNAIDAAIATLLCNGLVTMQSMGIGGGAIMTYYQHATREAVIITGRERAPLHISLKSIKNLQNATGFSQSALSIAVPGELAAYYEAHKRYGKLPWHNLIKPSLEICYRGYQLTRHQRDALFLNEPMIRKDKLLSQMFIEPKTNLFHKEGWLIRLPLEVCQSFETLMTEGPLSFYNGTLATLLIQDLQDMGSTITTKDLLLYKANVQKAFVLDLEPYNLYLPPPPASGHVLGFIIEILKYFKQDFVRVKKEFGVLEIHRIVEALKFGFVKRWEYDAEADYEALKKLFNSETVETVTELIDDFKTFNETQYYGHKTNLKPIADHGTAQISILAPNGDAVSVTSSINFYFGSGRMGSRTGVLFNNAMSDFNLAHLENYFNLPNIVNVNEIKPLKQPMSSMVPLIVTNKKTGDVRLVVGAAGGSRIISTLTQIIIRVLLLQQNIKQAIDAPRFHHQLIPNLLEYEFGLLQQIVDDLEKRGHKTERVKRKSTAVCGVEKTEQGIMFANADYRKEGGVDGF